MMYHKNIFAQLHANTWILELRLASMWRLTPFLLKNVFTIFLEHNPFRLAHILRL